MAGSRDDGINVDPEMAIKITDCSGLTKVLDPERHSTVPGDSSEPGERCGMTVDDGDERAMGGQCAEQPLSKALRTDVSSATGAASCCPACIQSVCRCDGKDPDVTATLCDPSCGSNGLRGNRSLIGDDDVGIGSGLPQPIGMQAASPMSRRRVPGRSPPSTILLLRRCEFLRHADRRKVDAFAKGDLYWPHDLEPYGPIECLRVSRRLAFERGDALVLGILFALAVDGPGHADAAMVGMGRKVADVA